MHTSYKFSLKLHAKKDDFPKARSRMFMKPFKRRIQTMGFERQISVEITFNMIDLNKIKAMNKVTE